MKSKIYSNALLVMLVFAAILLKIPAKAQTGSITVTSVAQRTNGSGLVDVYFNLSGPGSSYNIAAEASFNAGSTYTAVPAGFLSGNVSGISPGSNKHIVWDGLGSFPNLFTTQAKIKLIANPSGGSDTWPPGTVHCAGTPTAIVDVTNPATGKTWMDRNLGASRAAISSTDAQAYGDLYQWGRFSDGHQCRNSATTTTLSSTDTPGHENFILVTNEPWDWRSPQNNNLWQGLSGINNPCPSGYRLPTDAELNAERTSWSSNNAAGAYNSPLKLPVSGLRSLGDGLLYTLGSNGFCWSASVNGADARYLYFTSDDAGLHSNVRPNGFSVRCLKDTPSTQGSINTLNCSSATNNGTLTQGTPASGVNSVVPYTGGNGGTHNGQTISSTGVTGLTATLAPGSFANGNGTLTYAITGTPASSGTAGFALNIGGKSCSLSRTVTTSGSGTGQPCPGTPSVTDVDGNTYNTVLIGNQCWMKENLKTTKYRNGTNITYPGNNNAAWENNTSGAYAWYDNDISWKNLYGALYNWQAVNNSNSLCPTGWHVPSYVEWSQLTNYVVSQGYPDVENDPNGAGNALKSCRQVNSPLGGDCNTSTHPRWVSDGTHHGFDAFGFSALPGGYRNTDGSFYPLGYHLGSSGHWWNSTETSSTNAYHRFMAYYYGNVHRVNDYKAFGHSVRCLRD